MGPLLLIKRVIVVATFVVAYVGYEAPIDAQQSISCPPAVPAGSECVQYEYHPMRYRWYGFGWGLTAVETFPDLGLALDRGQEYLRSIGCSDAEPTGQSSHNCSQGGFCYQWGGEWLIESKQYEFTCGEGFTTQRIDHNRTNPTAQYEDAYCPLGYWQWGGRNPMIGNPPQPMFPTSSYTYVCWREPPPPPVMQRDDINGCLSVGNPCDVLVGNKRQRELDYESQGNGRLSFARTYNSLGSHAAKQGPFGKPLGEAWFGSYLQYISAEFGLNSDVVHVVRPDGDTIEFAATDPGSTSTEYEVGGEFKERLEVALNGSGTFVGWRYVAANDDEELYDTNGRLLTVQSRAGVTHVLTYGSNSRVESVADDFGNELTFQWDSESPPRVASITLPGTGSELVSFTYGQDNNLVSVTYPDATTREYLYELSGSGQQNLLTGIEDESDVRYATWEYGAHNVVTSSEHAGGVERYSIAYNADGSRYVMDPLGTIRTYTTEVIAGQRRYTGSNLLCQGCNEYASATFDAFGNFESKLDFSGVETRFTHDTARTLETSRTEAYGSPRERTTSTSWHSTYRLPTLITEPGRTTSFVYDTNGRLLEREITDTATSEARSTSWTYDAYGRVLTEDGPRTDISDVTTFDYYTCGTGYGCGQLASMTNALNQVTTFDSYDAHGQPLQITDPNGVITTLTYDGRQRLTSQTVGGESTAIEYWPTGLVKKVTLPNLSFALYTYDDAHRLTRIDDAAGNHIVYTLDGFGNRIAENVYDSINNQRRTSSRVFNNLNQLWQELTAAGTTAETTVYGYGPNGNVTTVDAPLGRSVVNVYDELNRLTQIVDAASGLTELAYDDHDNVVSVTDPRGLVTTYTYSALNDLESQTSPDTGASVRTHDSAGNVATSTDARGALSTYTYDSLNRLATVDYQLGGTTDQSLWFEYDDGANGVGRLTSAGDDNHNLAWEYDPQGRLTLFTQVVGLVNKQVSYAYTDGNLTTLMTPAGHAVVYGYNVNNQITSITIDGATLLSGVTYEPFGAVNGWTWGNSTAMSRTFDADGKVTAIASAGNKTYSYDDGFRMTGITDTVTSSNSYTYDYDALDRLTSAAKTGVTRGWTYDENGNRLSETGAAPSTYAISSTSNRVSSISGSIARTYTHDSAGSVLTYANTTATYNNRGRMKSFAVGATTANFTYDALGRLVKRTGGTPGTVYYVYDQAGHLLGEYDASGSEIQETIWLGEIPVATIRSQTVFYVHTDHLNTPRKVTRSSDNKARWSWESDPFGTDLPNENPESLGAFKYNLRFPGQIYDAHTGFMYNYFRDYDATTGRYAQSDPIGLAGGLNTYLYANGNPLRFIDPFGLEGIGYWTFPPGPQRDAFERGEAWSPAVNFSVGAGGMGMFGPFSASADAGVALDTRGNVCVYSTMCYGVGWQTPLAGALGLVGGVGAGEICSSQSDSEGVFWMGGKGIVGEGEVLIGPDGSSLSRGLLGVGWAVENPAGLGYKSCHTTLICN